ncbi:hypothetical protein B0H21DRAFT_781648 [Amylocystis lapponica]|nr:hypothetical protein B0H21DRAFT_781648 [Amylocystis lapponica]
MEEHKGLDRGSYIWGRSVHNTRIERLWCDVTDGYGKKWKIFFMSLEVHHRLDAGSSSHIWLLHHLFLQAINQDALEWAETWNAHQLGLRGSAPRSPRDLFLFGQVEEGPRGIEPFMEATGDASAFDAYGIDWAVYDDNSTMAHFYEHNPHEGNSFSAQTAPSHLSEVICNGPSCPLSLLHVDVLDSTLCLEFDLASRNMEIRRAVWARALDICELVTTGGIP